MRRRDFMAVTGLGALRVGLPQTSGSDKTSSGIEPVSTQEDPRFRELASLVQAKMPEYRVPGVAVGVLKQGQLRMRGFGLTNLNNPQPVTPETVFPLASITKTVVAVALLRLVEQGRVELDSPIVDYLPEFRLRDLEASRLVTIRHLLTHTSGWGELQGADHGIQTLERFVRSMSDMPLLARPGEVWGYNGAGFRVAGRALEVLTDSTIHTALDDLVFSPLGLTHAFTRTGDAMLHRFAAPHREGRRGTVVPLRFRLDAAVGGGGGAMSLSSLMAYAAFHLGDGTSPTGERVLRRSTLELMRTPQHLKRPTSDQMGVGWHLRHVGGTMTAVHCGTGRGHCLKLGLVPERDLAYAILTNHLWGWRLHSDLEAAILRGYEGLSLSQSQAIGDGRGSPESVANTAIPLSPQPALDDYAGTFERPPSEDRIALTIEGDRLVGAISVAGNDAAVPLTFWGPDRAYVDPNQPLGIRAYPYGGAPIEFVRDDAGQIRWCRFGGRLGRKLGTE